MDVFTPDLSEAARRCEWYFGIPRNLGMNAARNGFRKFLGTKRAASIALDRVPASRQINVLSQKITQRIGLT
jgi:hypothetical protein